MSKITVEIYKDKQHEYRWRIKAINHKIIAASTQGYTRRDNCITNMWQTADALAGAHSTLLHNNRTTEHIRVVDESKPTRVTYG